MLDTPILFVIFNRLDTTKRVFESIRYAKPKQLFIGADGPRSDKSGEAEKCAEIRALVLDSVDWECEVQTLFREENLGSGPAVSGAINWFFTQVNEGIILEDDCLPNNSFFEYASYALHHYEKDENIMHVSGCNHQCGIKRGNASYYFSKIPATWGWATWKRAWEKYSHTFFDDSNCVIKNVLERNFSDNNDVNYFLSEIQSTKNEVVSAWDYQWFYTLLKNNAICVTPQYNLITNLGFNSEGTHTTFTPYWYKYLVTKSVSPLVPADKIIVNSNADVFYLNLTMGRRTLDTFLIKLLYKFRVRMTGFLK